MFERSLKWIFAIGAIVFVFGKFLPPIAADIPTHYQAGVQILGFPGTAYVWVVWTVLMLGSFMSSGSKYALLGSLLSGVMVLLMPMVTPAFAGSGWLILVVGTGTLGRVVFTCNW